MASLVEDSMSLSSVLGDVGVHEFNDVVSDGRGEHGWHGDAVHNLVLVVLGIDANHWSGGHLFILDTLINK